MATDDNEASARAGRRVAGRGWTRWP